MTQAKLNEQPILINPTTAIHTDQTTNQAKPKINPNFTFIVTTAQDKWERERERERERESNTQAFDWERQRREEETNRKIREWMREEAKEKKSRENEWVRDKWMNTLLLWERKLNKKIFKNFCIFFCTLLLTEECCSSCQIFLAFGTLDEEWFLVFDVLNAINLTFSILNASALGTIS